ncbi:DUF1634 domain-containing protein [Bdellovibrio sp. BCCA]|uniref:DUF1634 domain-containing protein n=1 Tax=Bdellovibrio sp. BCCA TaxID=3136281 RepID=UPI0030F277CC
MSKENSAPLSLHQLEIRISQFLRGGVLFAGALLFVGWVWMLINSGDVLSTFSEYHPQSLSESIQWALIMNDRALLMSFFGLVVLVTLPVIRVLMTGILFIRQKDYRLAIMAFAVFFVLIASFTLGIDL